MGLSPIPFFILKKTNYIYLLLSSDISLQRHIHYSHRVVNSSSFSFIVYTYLLYLYIGDALFSIPYEFILQLLDCSLADIS